MESDIGQSNLAPDVQIKQEPLSPDHHRAPSIPPTIEHVKTEEGLGEKKATERENMEEEEVDGEEDEDDDDDMEIGPRILTHKAAMDEFEYGLAELIIGDELLNDLPAAITLEEVNSLISLEHGQAIVVNVRRADDVVLPVVVVQNGTVMDLKKALQRHVMLKQRRENGTEHISWRYVWRTYWLYYEGQKLMDDNKQIKEYGIRNRDEVTFLKRLKNK